MATARSKPKGLLAQLKKEVVVPEVQVTEDLTVPAPTREQMVAYREAQTGDDRLRAVYGDTYDEVIELFRDEPIHYWTRFHDEVMKTFFGPGADEVEGK